MPFSGHTLTPFAFTHLPYPVCKNDIVSESPVMSVPVMSVNVTAMHVMHIYNSVQDRTLPKAEWTHGAHLCAGTAILKEHGLSKAKHILPKIIKAYNRSCGVQNTQTEGYHHTLTLFYLEAIAKTLQSVSVGDLNSDDLGAKATFVLNAPLAKQDYPLRFYTKARLFSKEARLNWVEPDLQDLWSKKAISPI